MFLIFAGLSAAQFHAYLFESKGIGGFQIGLLLMCGQCAAILSPLLQVVLIRKFHGPKIPLMIMLCGAAVTLMLLPQMHNFKSFLILFSAFSFCAASLFSLNAACTLMSMSDLDHGKFFKIRTLGTMGFMVGCLISLRFTQLHDLPFLYHGFAAALLIAMLVVLWEYRQSGQSGKSVGPPKKIAPGFREALYLLSDPVTLRLLIILGLMNFANALATGVQANYLVHRWNSGQASISLAWVISTACEIPLMLFCVRVLAGKGLKTVIGLGILGTVLKLVGLASAHSLWQFYLALTMHGCFFSGALTGYSIYLDRKYAKEARPTLQTLSVVFYGGLPAAFAGLCSGWIWHSLSLRSVYVISGSIAIPIAIYAIFFLTQNRTGDFE